MQCSIPAWRDALLAAGRLQQELKAFLLPTLMDEAHTTTAQGVGE
jgi:hypothetical protein